VVGGWLPTAGVVALVLACPGGALACTEGALFFAWPGGGLVLGCAAAVLFLACPGGALFLAFPAAARSACPGGVCATGPFPAGGFAKAGHAKDEHSRTVPMRAGTRCKRERGDATVTNFLIGKRIGPRVRRFRPAVE
jgi:hypothetical protein